MELSNELWQSVNTVLGLVAGGAIWLVKILWARTENNAEKLTKFQLHVAETYAPYAALAAMRKEIVDHLVRIENRIDNRRDD